MDKPKPIAELLAEYNKMALKPLKAWKGSRAQLEAKIAAQWEALAGAALAKKKSEPQPPITDLEVPVSGDLKIRTAAEWARILGKNPKVVRAKLRKSGLKTPDGWGTIVEGSQAYKIIASIKGEIK